MSVAATTFSSSSLQRYHCDRYVFRGIKRGQLKSSTKSTKVVSSLQEGDWEACFEHKPPLRPAAALLFKPQWQWVREDVIIFKIGQVEPIENIF